LASIVNDLFELLTAFLAPFQLFSLLLMAAAVEDGLNPPVELSVAWSSNFIDRTGASCSPRPYQIAKPSYLGKIGERKIESGELKMREIGAPLVSFIFV